MAGNTVKLEFAGDADKLAKASKQAQGSLDDVEKATKGLTEESSKAGKESANFTDKIGKLGAGVSGMSDAIGNASGILDDFTQIQNQSYEQAQKQKRALLDVQQAQEDYSQAIRDSRQAAIDAGQAQIDKQQADLNAAKALKQYNQDVKDHGKNSLEAAQDLIDLKQAQHDVQQAVEDGNQAQRDASQATIDAKKAQLDLNDAQREAHPKDLKKFSQQLQTYTPLLQGLVGVVALVTAAQWAWNAAQLASPTTWIVLAIAALVAIVVLIATKTHWFQNIWKASWGAIKSATSASWDFIKKIPGWIGSAFKSVGNFIFAPFRWAFNAVSDAWNNTIGSLSWSVPGWVPFIGGDSISVPKLPHFHSGGVVPGDPSQEMLAVLRGGEEIKPTAGSGGADITIRSGGTAFDELLVEVLSRAIRLRGGDVQLVLGGHNAVA